MNNNTFSCKDLLIALNISPHSNFGKKVLELGEDDTANILRLLVEEVREKNCTVMLDSSCQTSGLDKPKEVLEKRLQQVHSNYLDRTESERVAPMLSIEARMLKYQRECDERGRQEIKLEVARVREVEIQRMRMEEAERYRNQLKVAQGEMESEFAQRAQRLRERETEIELYLKRKEREMEAGNYDHRQRMLNELEVLRERESNLSRATGIEQRNIRLEEERLQTLQKECQQQLADLERARVEMARNMENEMEHFRQDIKSKYTNRETILRRESVLLEEDKKAFAITVAHHEDRLKNLESTEQTLKTVEEAFKENKLELQATLFEVQKIRDKASQLQQAHSEDLRIISALEKSLKDARSHEAELEIQLSTEKTISSQSKVQYGELSRMKEQQIKELESKMAAAEEEHAEELHNLRSETAEVLDAHRNKWRWKEAEWKQIAMADNFKVAEMQREVDAFRRRCEEEEVSAKNARIESSRLREVLLQTQQALEAETRKPKNFGSADVLSSQKTASSATLEKFESIRRSYNQLMREREVCSEGRVVWADNVHAAAPPQPPGRYQQRMGHYPSLLRSPGDNTVDGQAGDSS